jgi:hypothetical protein
LSTLPFRNYVCTLCSVLWQCENNLQKNTIVHITKSSGILFSTRKEIYLVWNVMSTGCLAWWDASEKFGWAKISIWAVKQAQWPALCMFHNRMDFCDLHNGHVDFEQCLGQGDLRRSSIVPSKGSNVAYNLRFIQHALMHHNRQPLRMGNQKMTWDAYGPCITRSFVMILCKTIFTSTWKHGFNCNIPAITFYFRSTLPPFHHVQPRHPMSCPFKSSFILCQVKLNVEV